MFGLGIYELFAYATAAGDQEAAPAIWPVGSKLRRGDGFTIAMFVHPECPCSYASLAELAEISAVVPAVIVVVFAGPVVAGASWEAAGRIAGSVRVVDDGSEAARFGAQTSGYTVVYDHDGVR